MSAIAALVNGIEGWMTDNEIKALYDAALKAETVVEIGSYRGLSTVTLALAVQPSGGRVYAIDPHEGEKYGFSLEDEKHLRANLQAFGVTDTVDVITNHSVKVAKAWDKPVDLLWIDGDHEYDGVKADLTAWLPFVKRGGRVALHDFSPNWPGVQQAYTELLEDSDWQQVYQVDSLRIVERIAGDAVIPVAKAEKVATKTSKGKGVKANATKRG